MDWGALQENNRCGGAMQRHSGQQMANAYCTAQHKHVPCSRGLLSHQPISPCRDLWLECARRAFAGLDADSDGRLSVETLIGTLRDKLPATEVDYAVEDALVEAGYAGG